MENSTEVPQKINSRTTIWARNSTSRNTSKETKALCQRDICTMFLATLFTTAKTWKQHKCLSTHEGGIYTVEYWKVKVKVAQLGPTLCDPMDCIVHGTLQARILEWVAYPFFSGSSQPRNRTGVFCITGRFFSNWAIREAPISHKKEILPCTKTQMHNEGIMLSEIKQRKTYNACSHMWNPTENKIRQPTGEVWYVRS